MVIGLGSVLGKLKKTKKIKKLSMAVYNYNFSTWEAEAGWSQVWGQVATKPNHFHTKLKGFMVMEKAINLWGNTAKHLQSLSNNFSWTDFISFGKNAIKYRKGAGEKAQSWWAGCSCWEPQLGCRYSRQEAIICKCSSRGSDSPSYFLWVPAFMHVQTWLNK